MNFEKTPAGGGLRRWIPKNSWTGTSSFPMSADKSRKRCPSNRSYWRPLQKSSIIVFRWDFIGSFFCVCVPDIISKLKNKKLPVRTKFRSSFIFRNGGSTIWEQTTWWHRARKSALRVFLFSTDQYLKSAPDVVQYCMLCVFYSN